MEETFHDKGMLWKIGRWASKKAKKRIEPEYFPALIKGGRTAITTEDKVDLFYKECFPTLPEVDLRDIEGFRYPRLFLTKDETSLEEI